jgi:hypothetical protein
MLSAGTRNARAQRIDAVQAATNVWTGNGPDSLSTFSKAVIYARLRKGAGVPDGLGCPNTTTVQLLADTRSTDRYKDEPRRFSGTPQLRFTYDVPNLSALITCNVSVGRLSGAGPAGSRDEGRVEGYVATSAENNPRVRLALVFALPRPRR